MSDVLDNIKGRMHKNATCVVLKNRDHKLDLYIRNLLCPDLIVFISNSGFNWARFVFFSLTEQPRKIRWKKALKWPPGLELHRSG